MRLGDLTLGILQKVGEVAVQHAGASAGQRGCMLAAVDTLAARLDTVAVQISADDRSSAHLGPFIETSICGGLGGGLVEQAGSCAGDLGREVEVLLDPLDLLGRGRREPPAVSTGHEGHEVCGCIRPGLGRPRQRSQAGASGLVPNHGRDQPGGWHVCETGRHDRDQRSPWEHDAARNHQLRRRRRPVRSSVEP